MNKTITVYTDGSCLYHIPSRPGGWGSIILEHDKPLIKLSGSETNTTNNRMEYIACIRAIQYIINNYKDINIIIYSDSQLLCQTCSKWMFKWSNNNWYLDRKSTKPVKNLDLVKQLYNYTKLYNITFTWIKGHADNQYNNMADELATKESNSLYVNDN